MFQLNLLFDTENPVLPRDMDKLIVSYLKASVQNYSSDFFDNLFDKSKSILKSYSFAYYLPEAVFKGDKIYLGHNSFTIYFSDADTREILQFFNAFRGMQFKSYPMNGNSMRLISIGMQKLKEITDSEIVVKMQSSLLVRKHNWEDNSDIYYTYNQEGFAETLKENVKLFVNRMGYPVSVDEFSIIPIKGKKVVTTVFGRNTDANIGIFKLSGSPELLNLLYLAGIGVRRSEGHGKFQIIG